MTSIDCLDLERQYSPTLFTKRFQDSDKPNEAVLQNFIKITNEATTLARQLYRTRLDIRYGGENDNQLLDLYYKHQEHDTPIYIFIHGGFWQLLDKSASGPLVHSLLERNYRVIIVDYDLCPKVTLKQITHQMLNFFKWLKVYAEETKAPKITVCGHSVGAHLSLQMFASEELRPLHKLQLIDEMFLISGVYDLSDLWHLQSCNPHNIFDLTKDTARELSPQFWPPTMYQCAQEYSKRNMTFHVLVAENDSPAFRDQSKRFAEMLSNLKLITKYHVFNTYDHFDIIEEGMNENSMITEYMLREMGELE